MHIAAGLTVEWRSDRVYNSGIGTIFKRKGEFYEDYALQVNMTLSTQNCENISAEGATVANVGADKLQAGNTAAIQTLTAQINELSAALEQIKSIPGYESDETCMGQLAQLEAQRCRDSVICLREKHKRGIRAICDKDRDD